MKLFILGFLLIGNVFSSVDGISDIILKSERTLYVVDGDSLSLQMRIAGIDTPEHNQSCQKKPHKTLDCGQIAKNYLQDLLVTTPGKLSITPIAIGYYKRVLVRVYKGKTDIGRMMVLAGMAFSFKHTYDEEQQLAQSQKRGFWGYYTPPIEPYKYRKANTYQHKY